MLSRSSSSYKPLGEQERSASIADTRAEERLGEQNSHELTNISVISPLDSVVHAPRSSGGRALTKLGLDGLPPPRKREKMTWTNFHCMLCTGIAGFLVFWCLLLLRMYLPLENTIMVWWLSDRQKNKGNELGDQVSKKMMDQGQM